ncbi:hypothetical protein P3S67_026971 [Capsicum chacoense]
MQNMKSLRMLYMGQMNYSYSEDIHNSSIYLRWVVWHHCPWVSLPEKFEPQWLVHLDLRWNLLHHLWTKRKQDLPCLRRLDLGYSKSLKRTPDFTGMPNLEYLNLRGCTSLKEVHHSLRCCRKLIQLDSYRCESLERFPFFNVESLKYLVLEGCSSLEKFPEIVGRMKPKLEIKVKSAGIRKLPSSIFPPQACFTKLNLSCMKKLVALPRSIGMLKGLVKLDVSRCFKLENFPGEIGDLKNLVELDASYTLISQPPPSIVRLNKLKFLSSVKHKSAGGEYFVFPPVNAELLSLECLDISYCNIIDGGLPKDIGCLSSLKYLYLSHCNLTDAVLPEDIGCLSSLEVLDLSANNFECLPRSIQQLGALQSLFLSNCKRLTQLPELPQRLHTIDANWRDGSICNSLFQNISSLQHDISASDSSSLRVFM